MEIKYAHEMIAKTNKALEAKRAENRELALAYIEEKVMPEIESSASKGFSATFLEFSPRTKCDLRQDCKEILQNYGYKVIFNDKDYLEIWWK